jgi:hypothetical protein
MDRVLTPGRAIVAAGVIGFAAAALTAVISGIPTPQIHDEFSYLLAADTYAHARLTNPPHPLWQWFETFHELQVPTFMSKYPPAQGAFLALGLLIGLPIAGVWLSAALACAAVTWMLLAWLPERWALAGGALLALHPTMLGWSHSYWGAAVAVLGGALTIGGARRLIDVGRVLNPSAAAKAAAFGGGRVETPSHIRGGQAEACPTEGSRPMWGQASACPSLLLGLGVVLLATTRPWEGFVFVAALVVVAAAMRLLRWRALVPAALVIAAGSLFILYANWRVTRDPLLMPYALYERQYNFTPPLVWQSTHPVALRQKTMQHITKAWAYDMYRERRTPGGFLWSIPKTIVVYANGAFQFVPDTLLVRLPDPVVGFSLSMFAILQELVVLAPMFFLGRVLRRDRAMRALAVVAVVTGAIALLPAVVPLPHYGGPLVPIMVLFWLASVREVGSRRVLAGVVAAWLFAIVFFFVENRPWRYRWDEVAHRLDLLRAFESRPGRHLVLVRYLPSHNPHFEWAQNGAERETAHVVWAHDLGDNRPLIRYYPDRTAWLLTVGDRETALEPYGRSPAPAPRPPATPGPASSD